MKRLSFKGDKKVKKIKEKRLSITNQTEKKTEDGWVILNKHDRLVGPLVIRHEGWVLYSHPESEKISFLLETSLTKGQEQNKQMNQEFEDAEDENCKDSMGQDETQRHEDNPQSISSHKRKASDILSTLHDPLHHPKSSLVAPSQISCVFVAMKLPDGTMAFKSAQDKFISLHNPSPRVHASTNQQKTPLLVASKEAVAITEQFKLIPHETRDAFYIQFVASKQFLAVDVSENEVGDTILPCICNENRPFAFEVCGQTRFNRVIEHSITTETASKGYEEDLIKRYHSNTLGKFINTSESDKELKRAKMEGRLHDELIERRTRIKSDKFCK